MADEFPIKWLPPTHLGYEFRVARQTHPDTGRFVCGAASLDGVALDDPQGVCDKVYAENATVSQAQAALVALLPPEMLKPVLDGDNDPTFDDAGNPVMVIKDKHQPIIVATSLGDATPLVVPGTAQFPGLDARQCAALAKGLEGALAANELVTRLQPLVAQDLTKSVVLRTADKVAAREG